MSRSLRSCRKDGHGPSVVVRRRVWWKPWCWHTGHACWACRAPLSLEEAAEADVRWGGLR